MNVKKKWFVRVLVFVSVLALNGCAVRRKADSVLSETGEDSVVQVMNIYQIENSCVDPSGITEVFIDRSLDDAEEYKFEKRGCYEVDGKTLVVALKENEETVGLSDTKCAIFVSYYNENEGAYSCYSAALLGNLNGNLQRGLMRRCFPEENLEICSKEDAIEACRPYAEACGYEDCAVSVYAATLDIIQESVQIDEDGDGVNDDFFSAPGSGFEVVTGKQIDQLRTEGKDEEALILANHKQRGATLDREIPWEEKHEALILTYQPILETYEMAEQFDLLVMIYVPMYGYPVYVQGWTPYRITGIEDTVNIISKAEAIGEVLLHGGYKSLTDIEVEQIKLVYAPQSVLESGEFVETAIPCWSVEYRDDEDLWQNVMIDAVHGDVYQRNPRP